MSDFDQVIKRKGTQSYKWDFTKELFGHEDVLPMWVADMDFKSPDAVIAALKERVEHGVYGYTGVASKTKKSVQNWLKTRHGWEISADSLDFCSGVVEAMSIAIQALTEEGDRIVIQPPVYKPFFDMVKYNKRIVVENELVLKDGRYSIDFEDLAEKLADPSVKMLILCNPQNPSGRVWTKEELAKIGELCLENGVFVFSDEIHSDILLFGNKHTPFASISESFAQNSITAIAPSKTFNLAGLQASAVIIPDRKILGEFKQVKRKQGHFSLNIFGITAMEAAYNNGHEWLDSLLLYLEENVKLVEQYIGEHLKSINVIHPDSTYLIWLDCRSLNMTEQQLKKQLLEKGKLALELGSKYGKAGEGFVRMNIGCPRQMVLDGLKRLKTALS
ncbi:MalY/PatB family protein [Aeribacillus composti]|uniref:MalY/PatB family protein n=1 Tax=Aeribacillus composti TaxID=1868734 RepID=UPI002E21F859|nr:pyridoxal phosphate-dependent aminotransferase [Aeribacillus composti]